MVEFDNAPIVSICIPVYGVEKFIERCARSVLEQTYSNIEYIFVDDCSKDNSIVILKNTIKDYPHRLPFINIVSHKSNEGIAITRNTALNNCHGDFVFFVDSDDYVERNALELLVKRYKETNADIISGNAIRETINGNELLIEPNYNNKEETVLNYMQQTIDHVLWKRIIRLSLFKKYNITCREEINVGEDMQLMVKCAYYADKMAKIDDVIYHYNCTNENSYMSQKGSGFKRNIAFQDIASIEVLEDFFKDKEEKYKVTISNIKYHTLKHYLENAYRFKDAKAYHYFVNKILNLGVDYINDLGWNNKKALIVNRNYYLRYLFEKLTQ